MQKRKEKDMHFQKIPWQEEFESSFYIKKTEDQIAACKRSKRYGKYKANDRLLCGDVGDRKTEVKQ